MEAQGVDAEHVIDRLTIKLAEAIKTIAILEIRIMELESQSVDQNL